MATDRMDVLELLRKATSDGDVDLLREGVRVLSQALMEAEVAAEIGAAHGERAPERRSTCLLYTSPSPRDGLLSRMPSSA